MPSHAPNYSEGKIYALVSTLDPRLFIATTTQPLKTRFKDHRAIAYSTRSGPGQLYKVMRSIGVGSYTVKLLENFPCQSRAELEKRKAEIIATYPADQLLNRQRDEIRAENSGSTHWGWRGGVGMFHQRAKKCYRTFWRDEEGNRKSRSFTYGGMRTEEEARALAEELKVSHQRIS